MSMRGAKLGRSHFVGGVRVMTTAAGVSEGCRRRRAVGLGPPEPDAVPHREASEAGAPVPACDVACECNGGGDRWRPCRERETVGVSVYSGERGPGGVRVSPVARWQAVLP